MEFDATNFAVVETGEGILQTEDGICLQSKIDGRVYFVQPSEEIMQTLNLNTMEDPSSSEVGATIATSVGKCSSDPDEQNKRTRWSKDGILMLIDLRIKYDEELKSTTNKNEVTWKKAAEELKTHGYNMSSTQCNDKWRYLKTRYTSKKDNMGDRGSGEAPIDFSYFEVMDNFLGQKHNVKPIAIASSIQGDTITDVEEPENVVDNSDDDAVEPPKRKKRITSNVTNRIKNTKTGLQVIMDEMKQSSMERENNRERRHQEMMGTRNNAINVFSAKMDLLIETLNK